MRCAGGHNEPVAARARRDNEAHGGKPGTVTEIRRFD